MKIYRNGRGGEYAVQDRGRRGQGLMWTACHRPRGGTKWSKLPGMHYHARAASAQIELDVYAQRHGLKEEEHGSQ